MEIISLTIGMFSLLIGSFAKIYTKSTFGHSVVSMKCWRARFLNNVAYGLLVLGAVVTIIAVIMNEDLRLKLTYILPAYLRR
jgi:vacuolar-type H+-ATPase subunit I/STV1